MGDIGDIRVDSAYSVNPESGSTAIRIDYAANGRGPSECNYAPPCKWAGVYWLDPPNYWGKKPYAGRTGYDLTGYKRLTFWARADRTGTIEFKVGGINEPYGDSLTTPVATQVVLGKNWRKITIELNEVAGQLTHIIGGFVWVSNWEENPKGITFYLDEIRFER